MDWTPLSITEEQGELTLDERGKEFVLFFWIDIPLQVVNDLFLLLYTERGNPGGIPALYAGGVTDFIKADPIILRPDLYHLNRSLEVRFVRTLRDRSKWLNG